MRLAVNRTNQICEYYGIYEYFESQRESLQYPRALNAALTMNELSTWQRRPFGCYVREYVF